MQRISSLTRQIFLSSRALADLVTDSVKFENFQFSMTYAAILPVIDLEGTRLTVIARRTSMSKQALFPYINELEAAGYLSKIEDPHDRRANLLRLTIKGRSLLERLSDVLMQLEEAAAKVMGEKGYAAANDGLVQLTNLAHAQKNIQLHTSQASAPSRADLFGSTFTHAAIGMALLTLDGRWLDVNASLCEIVGYTKPELLKLTFQDITHPDDLETDLGLAKQLLDGEIPSYHLEKRYFKKNGDVVWVQLTGSLVRHADGSPYHFIAQIQDINARKDAERERQKK